MRPTKGPRCPWCLQGLQDYGPSGTGHWLAFLDHIAESAPCREQLEERRRLCDPQRSEADEELEAQRAYFRAYRRRKRHQPKPAAPGATYTTAAWMRAQSRNTRPREGRAS